MWGVYLAVFFALATNVFAQTCLQAGYTYPDVDNCHNYYRCDNNLSPKKYSCPFALSWNCDTSTCQRMRVSKCCPNDNMFPCLIPGARLPNMFNCSVYYQCTSFKWVKNTCAAGQRFDPVLMRCRTAYLGKCALSGALPTSAPGTTAGSGSGGSGGQVTTTTTSTSTTTTPSTSTSTTTPTTTTTTTPTTTTSTTTTTTPTTTTTTPTTTTTTPTTTTTTPTTTTTTPTTTTTTTTPAPVTSTIIIPAPVTTTTTTTTTTTPVPPVNQVSSTTPPPVNNAVSTTTVAAGSASKDMCISNMTISNVFNCQQYYQCSQNSIKKFTCPSSTPYYNCWKRTCTANKRPFCCTPGLSWIPNTSCPENGVKTSIATSCISYYECVNGKITMKFCALGQAFDTWTKTCISPLKARCGIKPALDVCTASMNGTLPFGSINLGIQTYCLKWQKSG